MHHKLPDRISSGVVVSHGRYQTGTGGVLTPQCRAWRHRAGRCLQRRRDASGGCVTGLDCGAGAASGWSGKGVLGPMASGSKQAEPDYVIRLELLSPADGGGWLATESALPGCTGDGDTPEAALADAESAIIEWIDAARQSCGKISNGSLDNIQAICRI